MTHMGNAPVSKVEADRLRTLLTDEEIGSGMQTKNVALQVHSICLSLMYKKSELLTFFVAGMKLAAEEERGGNTKIHFDIGYAQVDNQQHSEPGYAVMLRPRDLLYDCGKIKIN